MASQAAVYVQAIAMLSERAEAVRHSLGGTPDAAQRRELEEIERGLALFRARLRRTEEVTPARSTRS